MIALGPFPEKHTCTHRFVPKFLFRTLTLPHSIPGSLLPGIGVWTLVTVHLVHLCGPQVIATAFKGPKSLRDLLGLPPHLKEKLRIQAGNNLSEIRQGILVVAKAKIWVFVVVVFWSQNFVSLRLFFPRYILVHFVLGASK